MSLPDIPMAPSPRRVHHTRLDARGCRVSGGSAAALGHYEAALAASLAWRGGADAPLALALAKSPGFVMAHVMKAWLLLLGRDVRRVRRARAVLDDAVRLRPAGGLLRAERLHLAAVAAVLDDDYPGAKALLGVVLRDEPRDVLALQTAHSLDYLTGDLARLADRVGEVLPAWAAGLPGYHAVLAMRAFGLVERGETAAAERAAHAALALNPLDARAHHALAHAFEARGQAAEGARWLARHRSVWATSTAVATHCAWHLALFHAGGGNAMAALDLYDRAIAPPSEAAELADLIDASALLWRLELGGTPIGARWQALADAWAPRIDDAFCSFADVHAMLAFVGARQWDRARQLESTLRAAGLRATRHGATTRTLGLPAGRALIAYGRGEDALALALLSGLRSEMHRLGGSHAQRDVLQLTLQRAAQRIGLGAAEARGAARVD